MIVAILVVSHLVAFSAGAYAYYRYGPALRADVQKVETAVTNFKGKVSK